MLTVVPRTAKTASKKAWLRGARPSLNQSIGHLLTAAFAPENSTELAGASCFQVAYAFEELYGVMGGSKLGKIVVAGVLNL